MMLVSQDMCMPIYILLDHPLKQVRENMVFSLSNFFSNGERFVKAASSLMLDTKIIVMLERESLDVRIEAVWALSNLLDNQTIE